MSGDVLTTPPKCVEEIPIGVSRSKRMAKNEEGLKRDAIASKWLFPLLLIVF
jgi:hypothetical protein